MQPPPSCSIRPGKLRKGTQLLAAVVRWFLWLLFSLSPFGAIYYFLKAHTLDGARLRNKTLQGGVSMLHYVTTQDGWRLAVVRYPAQPSPVTQDVRNHPVLMIHGLSANRLAFDVTDGPSLARTLSSHGFDVWVLEMRGSNLSFHPQYHTIPSLKQWVFDDYVQKDIPVAIEFILQFTGAAQVHCVGHSMGGLLSTCHVSLSPERARQVRSNVLLGSSVVYHQSGSTYQKVTPFYILAKVFPNVAQLFIPHGLVSRLIYLVMGRGLDFLPLYSFQCNPQNTDPAVVRRVYRFGFHTIPLTLMLSLHSAVRKVSGMADAKRVPYLDHMRRMVDAGGHVPPTFLLGGERDQQCPVGAVETTFQRLQEIGSHVQAKYFGQSYGHVEHYGHFDLLVGKRAETEVFPHILQFLKENDAPL